MFCPKCGTNLPDRSRFCMKCGSSMADNAAPVTPGYYQPTPQQATYSMPQQQQARYASPQQVRYAPQQQAWNTAGTRAIQPVAQPAVQPVPAYNRSAPQQPAWQAPATPQQVAAPRPIKTDRSVVVFILLSALTFGIYGYYFIYSAAQDMNVMCDQDSQNTGGLVAFILLSFITFGIYGVYWWYKIANRAYMNGPRYGAMITDNGGTFLLWYVLGLVTFGICSIIAIHKAIQNVNKLAMAYNQRHGFVYA